MASARFFALGAIESVHFTCLGGCMRLHEILIARCDSSGWADFLDELAIKYESDACAVFCVARMLHSSSFSYERYLRYHMRGGLCLVPISLLAQLY